MVGKKLIGLSLLLSLAGCADLDSGGSAFDGTTQYREDETAVVVQVPREPEFGRYPALGEAAWLGSTTLQDIESHMTNPERVHPDLGDNRMSRAFFGTLVASFEAQAALGTRDVVVYLLSDRVVRLPEPTMPNGQLRPPGIRHGIDGMHGKTDEIQQYWAAYVHRAMTRAELDNPSDNDVSLVLLEMSYLAAFYYSEIEKNDPDYITPAFENYMQWQMSRATQAAADAGRVQFDGDITRFHARAAELRELGKDLSPHAAALLHDFMHLPAAVPAFPGQ